VCGHFRAIYDFNIYDLQLFGHSTSLPHWKKLRGGLSFLIFNKPHGKRVTGFLLANAEKLQIFRQKWVLFIARIALGVAAKSVGVKHCIRPFETELHWLS
jgi:hypothetical protein